MSVTGLCSVCERREAEYVCERCGAAVCAAHYERGASLCTNCAAETDRAEPENDRRDPDTEHRL